MGSCTSGVRMKIALLYQGYWKILQKAIRANLQETWTDLFLMFWPNYHTNVLFIAFISQNIRLQKIEDTPLLIKALLKPNEWGISLKWDVISKSHLREAISQTGPRDAVIYKRPQKTETFHERTTKFFWVFNCFGLIIMKQVFGVIFSKDVCLRGLKESYRE